MDLDEVKFTKVLGATDADLLFAAFLPFWSVLLNHFGLQQEEEA